MSINTTHEIRSVIDQAKDVLRIEAQGLDRLVDRIGESFVKMVEVICESDGRVIVAGIGKSGIVGRKIVATLNSTGTRSLFLHPVEAMHGDLGIVAGNDVFIGLSKSGETDELNFLVHSIRKIGCTVIAFTGNLESTLARYSDIVIDVGVEREACPLGLAPTASTTAALAMGDALAVVLIHKKQFNSGDFKKNHPGGTLGRRLSLQVQDIMLTGDAIPAVSEGTVMQEAVRVMDKGRLGVVLIVREDRTLCGIITDGDLRRMIAQGRTAFDIPVDRVMGRSPRTIEAEIPLYDALHEMEAHQITILPVVNPMGKVRGILHLHDILGKGSLTFHDA